MIYVLKSANKVTRKDLILASPDLDKIIDYCITMGFAEGSNDYEWYLNGIAYEIEKVDYIS